MERAVVMVYGPLRLRYFGARALRNDFHQEVSAPFPYRAAGEQMAPAYLDLLIWGWRATQIFSQNLRVQFLVISKPGESLIFVVFFFFFNLMPDPLRIDFCVVIF
jgi:hypothetical protein